MRAGPQSLHWISWSCTFAPSLCEFGYLLAIHRAVSLRVLVASPVKEQHAKNRSHEVGLVFGQVGHGDECRTHRISGMDNESPGAAWPIRLEMGSAELHKGQRAPSALESGLTAT